MPCIAAESRNADANGQYVRSLANGANYAYPTGDGRFYLTGDALLGVNPPKVKDSPPLRADVPCETQQPPDLRSTPDAPPAAKKVNWNAPGVQAASLKSRLEALRWLRKEIERRGLGIKVSEEPLLRSQIKLLDRAVVGK
jgi:phospholipid/cholesterol/gamma-HCH transport system substrate-binding protein